MPFQGGDRLPAERASKLGHLDVLKSPLVKQLCSSFEDPSGPVVGVKASWAPIGAATEPVPLVFGVDGSMQVIESDGRPKKALGFVKTALVTLDRPSLETLDQQEPHPFAVRDILEKSQLYHATVFPLRHVYAPGLSTYHSIRQVICDSLRDPSLDGEVFETLKWLSYEKWSGEQKSLPLFDCPHCRRTIATLPYDADDGRCPGCQGTIFLPDMLGFHQIIPEESAPNSVASDYMEVHVTLLLFTGVRYFWENKREMLPSCLFVKDGPLSIRAQYSKLVNPIRRFLNHARDNKIEVCLVGQEKSGAFWDHLQAIGDDAPDCSFFVPDDAYIREEVQHRPNHGGIYGKDTNYGAKVFLKLDSRHKFIISIPNGDAANPQSRNLIGAERIFATIPHILSAQYEDALLPVQMAHAVASLSTYPSARVLYMFAEAVKSGAAASTSAAG